MNASPATVRKLGTILIGFGILTLLMGTYFFTVPDRGAIAGVGVGLGIIEIIQGVALLRQASK